MILSLSKVKKSFTQDIIKDATFTIGEKEKAGLIGVNGAGKSTILKIITGEIPPDSGQVILKQDISLGYLSQGLPDLKNTVYQELSKVFDHLAEMEEKLTSLAEQISANTKEQQTLLAKYDILNQTYEQSGGYIYKSRLRGVISGLGFDENTPLEHLSGGQKTTLAMARLLLSDSSLLLLDEPTNHLDLKSVTWLEGFLQSYPGAAVIISHDRYFINRTVSKIVELEHGIATTYSGNYTAYLEKKQEQQKIALHHYQSRQNEIKAMEDSISLLKSFNREKSVKRARSKEKALEKMERPPAPTAAPRSLRLNLEPTQISGNDVLALRNFSVPALFPPINLDIKRGERVALIGPVGIGKSTMFKALLGRADHEGTAIFGSKVATSYYEQHQEQGLNVNNTILEEIHSSYPMLKNVEVRNTLASFTFVADDVYKKIHSLSGGEKAKVLMAKVMLSGGNFLMLDEPTNHLDITSKEILEEALSNFPGTCFFISHDRYFINRVATKIVELSKNGTKVYLGNYDYYIEKTREIVPERPIITKERSIYQEQKQQEAAKRKAQNRLKILEAKISDLEMQIKNIDYDLNQITDHFRLAEIYKTKEALEQELITLYEEWEALA